MDGKRLEKVNRLIQKELGDIFQKELKPKVPMLMITVTHVRVTVIISIGTLGFSSFWKISPNSFCISRFTFSSLLPSIVFQFTVVQFAVVSYQLFSLQLFGLAKIGISFEIDWESGRETLKMIIFARILTK